jgi:hypothetical protein
MHISIEVNIDVNTLWLSRKASDMSPNAFPLIVAIVCEDVLVRMLRLHPVERA